MAKMMKEKKTGEMYKSKSAMMKHEKSEGKSERMKEYGKNSPKVKMAAKPKMAKAKKR